MNLDTSTLLDFHRRQLEVWPMAAANFAALASVSIRSVPMGDVVFYVQHNPSRIRSTGAKVDKATLASRPCFLCGCNRPFEQMRLNTCIGYEVLVNPFPIFPVHFTIPAEGHVPQLLCTGGMERFADMMRLSLALPGMALFYNGGTCGASAPDHFHFQAVETFRLPIFEWVGRSGVVLPFMIETAVIDDLGEGVRWFADVCRCLMALETNRDADEPKINVLCAAVVGTQTLRVIVIPRKAHRPDFYGNGDNEVLLSPASVDLAGVMVAPAASDFEHKINSGLLQELLRQTCFVQ